MNLYRHDLKPDLVIDITDKDAPVDLSSATSIRIIGVTSQGPMFDRAPNEVTGGTVVMLWQPSDTAQEATITVEVEVTWPVGKPQTFRPNERVYIRADLG